MSSTLKSLLKQFASLKLRNVGKTKVEDLARNGEGWVGGLANLAKQMQDDYGVSGYDIQGSKPHQSSTDPEDKEKVVTVGFYSEEIRQLSAHLHEDGTFKYWESRAGKDKTKVKHKGGGSSSKSGSSSSRSVANIEYIDGAPVYQHSDGNYYPVYEDEETREYYYTSRKGHRYNLR